MSGFISALDEREKRLGGRADAIRNLSWGRCVEMLRGAQDMNTELARLPRVKISDAGAFSFDHINRLTEREMYMAQQKWGIEQAGDRLFGGEKSYNIDASGAMALGQKMYELAKLRRQLRRHRALLARAVRGVPQGATTQRLERFESAMKLATVSAFLMGVPDTWGAATSGDDDCAELATTEWGADLWDAGAAVLDKTIGVKIMLVSCEVAQLFDSLILAKASSGRADATITSAWAVGYCAAVGLNSAQMRRLRSGEPHLMFTPHTQGASRFSDAARSLMVLGAISGQ